MPKKYYTIELAKGIEIHVYLETLNGLVINYVVKLVLSVDKMYYLKLASVSFAEYTRHQARSRIIILQAFDNAVDSVKEALPKGSTFWQENLRFLALFRCCFFGSIF